MFVDFSYVLLWFFLQQDLWLHVAYGCVSSAQVVTCEKAGPSLRKKESTILIYNIMNLE